MGKIAGYETKEKIDGKIRDATEFINAIVKDIKEKGGIEHLPPEEVKSLAEETIPEFIRYIESLEKYIFLEFEDKDLVDELKEVRPFLEELRKEASLLMWNMKKGKVW
jgi:hypothetical protein